MEVTISYNTPHYIQGGGPNRGIRNCWVDGTFIMTGDYITGGPDFGLSQFFQSLQTVIVPPFNAYRFKYVPDTPHPMPNYGNLLVYSEDVRGSVPVEDHTHDVETVAGDTDETATAIDPADHMYRARGGGTWDIDDPNQANWTTFDASSIAPEGACAAVLKMFAKNNTNGEEFTVRQDATHGTVCEAPVMYAVAGLIQEMEVIVGLTAARTFQYRMSGGGNWNYARIAITGWYEHVDLPTKAHVHGFGGAGTVQSNAKGGHAHAYQVGQLFEFTEGEYLELIGVPFQAYGEALLSA